MFRVVKDSIIVTYEKLDNFVYKIINVYGY